MMPKTTIRVFYTNKMKAYDSEDVYANQIVSRSKKITMKNSLGNPYYINKVKLKSGKTGYVWDKSQKFEENKMNNDIINLGQESHRDGTTVDYIFKKSTGKFYAVVHGFAIGQNSSNRATQLKVNTIEDLKNDLKGKNIKWSDDAFKMFPELKENKMKKLSLRERKLVKQYIKRLTEQTHASDLDKRFKNTHDDLSIVESNTIQPDNSGPWATTATDIVEYTVISLSNKKYDKNDILNWAREIWKSSYMIDRTVEKVLAFKGSWIVTVKTTVWQN